MGLPFSCVSDVRRSLRRTAQRTLEEGSCGGVVWEAGPAASGWPPHALSRHENVITLFRVSGIPEVGNFVVHSPDSSGKGIPLEHFARMPLNVHISRKGRSGTRGQTTFMKFIDALPGFAHGRKCA